jgi:GNAT superfamily N-acetyltransferase/predicted nucleic acid-binding protein
MGGLNLDGSTAALMVKRNGGEGGQSVQVRAVASGETQLIDQVIALGDSANQTLGFLPATVFRQAAYDQRLLAALQGARVIGYALFSLPRQEVRLVHLCVDPASRGRGIARRLVQEISDRHSDRIGIVLKCREDFSAHNMWPKLGFQRVNQVRGRGKAPTTLVVWVRDHGHPNLFSVADTSAILRVALDLNVFLDLHSLQPRPQARESKALTADWLSEQIELEILPELIREIDLLPNPSQREQQRATARSNYKTLPVDASTAEKAALQLADYVREHEGIDLSGTRANRSDIQHIAEVMAAGLRYFVTRDEGLINRVSDSALKLFGIRILRPADVIVHLDELTRAQVYRPADLLHTEYAIAAVGSGREQEMLAFLDEPGGEHRTDFLLRMREIAATIPQWERRVIHDPGGEAVAVYATGKQQSTLVVPILRVKPHHRLSDTIARQVLFLLRQECRSQHLPLVRITDPHLPRVVRLAATDDGFFQHNTDLVTFVIDLCAETAAIDAALAAAAAAVSINVPPLPSRPSSILAAALERRLWPAKLLDSRLRSFLVPIWPVWSSELFGIPRSLFPRPDLLGISREHVYYRSPRSHGEEAPARLLWYVTNHHRDGVRAVVACSRLEEILIDDPRVLHGRLRHLGVWHQEQVDQVAHNGRVRALRFVDTEILPRQISLDRVRELAGWSKRHPTQGPRKIPTELFAAIYKEGRSTS